MFLVGERTFDDQHIEVAALVERRPETIVGHGIAAVNANDTSAADSTQ